MCRTSLPPSPKSRPRGSPRRSERPPGQTVISAIASPCCGHGLYRPEITGKSTGYLSPSAGPKFAKVPNVLAAISEVIPEIRLRLASPPPPRP
eukprot:16437695-Heterocapsa_arctica.AAC.1